MKENQKIPMWKKICYGCGAGGGNVMSTLLASFLLSYYTDTALINAASIATMYVVSRLLDGVTDLVMGGIVDKTHTKWGKTRPWILISAPLMMIGMILILNVPADASDVKKLIYAYVTYIFLNCFVYTIFSISHAALLARMTRDVNERNTTSAVSSICNNLSGLIVGTVTTVVVINYGWTVTSIIFGLAACILIAIPALTVKETVGMGDEGEEEKELLPIKIQLPAVLKNRYFFLSILIGTLTLLMNANAIASLIYYCNVVLGEPEFMTQLMSIGQLPGILILFLMPWFSNKFSKRSFMLIGTSCVIIGFIILGFAGTNHTMLLIGTMLRSLGTSPVIASTYALIADACDYGEWKTGIRSEGLMSSATSIGAKIGIGFGSAATGWILAFVGYDATATAFSDTVIKGIIFDFSWFGAIVSALLFVSILLMDVEKYLPEIHKALENQ